MQFSDGVKIRAEIDTQSMRAVLTVAAGGSVALLAFLPYLLGNPDMHSFARFVVAAFILYQLSLVLCLVHNVLRRHCSSTYEDAWREEKQPDPGQFLGIKLKKHPTVCFYGWLSLWLAIGAFIFGSILLCSGTFAILRATT